MLTVSAIRCSKCKDIVFSRTRRDFRSCTCGSAMIDGGFDYMKISGEPSLIDVISIEIKQSLEELYEDWNMRKDKYGLYKKGRGVKLKKL